MDQLQSFPTFVPNTHRTHQPTTVTLPVPWLKINMLGVKAKWAMIPVAAVGQWQYFFPTLGTDKSHVLSTSAHVLIPLN